MNGLLNMTNSGFPEDIANELLKILPVKSVVRFRCVCKSWDSIITNPLFAKLHRCPTLGLLLYYEESNMFKTINCEDYKIVSREFPEARNLRSRHDYKVWGSCNGFVCFGYSVGSKYKVNLWNPLTGEVMVLPAPEAGGEILGESWNFQFGFGWDKNIGDYKVVRLVHRNQAPDLATKLDVLSLKTKTWVRRDDLLLNLGFCTDFPVCKMMFFDGFLHWQAFDNKKRFYVIGFDLAEEKFQPRLHIAAIGELGVISGNLCLTINWSDSSEVWVMKDYRYSVKPRWNRLVSVSIRTSAQVEEPYVDTCKLISLSNDGEVIGLFKSSEFLARNGGQDELRIVVKLAGFNMNGQTSVIISDSDTIKLIEGNPQAVPYEETLASYIQWSVDRYKKRKRNKLQKH